MNPLPPRRRPVILNVDDEEIKRYTITRILRRDGYEVKEAESGQRALELVAGVDLVILDVNLPDMDGFEVCRRIKADPATAALPVLHLSATYVQSVDRVHGLDVGADAYLTQEVEPAELVATIRALLRTREAEEQARRLAEQWQTTFDAISDGIALLDEHGSVVQSNAAMQRLMAEAPALAPNGARAGAIARCSSHRKACRETEACCGRWFEVSCHPIGTEARQGLVYVLSDVTARKQAEVALERSEGRVRRLIEANVIGVLFGDMEGNVLEANHAFLDMLGYATPGFDVLSLKWPDLTAPESKQVESSMVDQLRRTGAAGPYEKELLGRDGQRVPVLAGMAMLPGAAGEIVAYMLDLRQLKETEAALRRSNEDLRQFAYAASHDLQEPLRTVTSFAQMLERSHHGKLGAEADQYIDYIVGGSQRMLAMIEDLLSYSRAAHETEVRREVMDANAAYGKAVENLSKTIEDSGAVVSSTRLPDDLFAHESHIVQVFQNLIGNALKYRSTDRMPEVRVGCERLGQEWLFSVSDNGIGIDPKYQKQIFGIFKRLHGPQYSGTGIGLALCQRLVERYGGRIWVESMPGEGSTFYFTIPVWEPAG